MKYLNLLLLILLSNINVKGQIKGMNNKIDLPEDVERKLTFKEGDNGILRQYLYNGEVEIFSCLQEGNDCSMRRITEHVILIATRNRSLEEVGIFYDGLLNEYYPKYDESKYHSNFIKLYHPLRTKDWNFNEFPLIHKETGLVGLVDRNGEVILPFEYNFISSESHSQRLIRKITNDEDLIFVYHEYDKSLVKTDSDIIDINNGWAIYQGEYDEKSKKFLLGVKYLNGDIVIKAYYTDIRVLGNHFLVDTGPNSNISYIIDQKSNVLLEVLDQDKLSVSMLNETFTIIKQNGNKEVYSFKNSKFERI